MEESTTGLLPPLLFDAVTFISIILSIILLIALSYLWSTRRQDREDVRNLSLEIKGISKKIKNLELELEGVRKATKLVENVPEAEPFGISVNKKKPLTIEANVPKAWDSFLENYNHIAESMAVPGQLRACEKFVADNNLKLLSYGGDINFIEESSVENSRFWAWQIESSNRYAVVPNPMITYNGDLHNRGGMKETFASNYEKGSYKKYFVKLPAILDYINRNSWKLSEPGIMDLG